MGDGNNSRGLLLSSGAAILSVLAASSCCLPVLPLVFAAGAAGGSVVLWTLRPYLLAVSVLSIGVGFYQARRATQCNRRPRVLNLALLWFAAAAVVTAIVSPELLANYGGSRTPAGQPPLARLDLASLERQFNAASGSIRVVVLLSPT